LPEGAVPGRFGESDPHPPEPLLGA
jgi:hypothetical protein